ncbi:beta-N-acetylglucosaminidase [Bacteroides neonati]|uniref:beta-N-acetylglucosaminidase n=1 Tax=Bacteroides neonati TaxID=1347393 RepID=UPI0004ADE382|nr:beta-N-acetylglucosaminidase [Bacteroides neonati]
MKKKSVLFIGTLLLNSIVLAQTINVQPQPQQIATTGKRITLPTTYTLTGAEEANPIAVSKLQSLLSSQPGKKGFRILIGEKGDKSIRAFNRFIPTQAEGYYLKIDNKQLVIAGNNERGTYYAMQTLLQLLKDNQLPEIEITDFPAIRFRGVVEGFYGTPWSHEARLRQLQFYGENKMNTYIYGPKDDPYHSAPNWRLPYPEKEAKQLAELVQSAHENEVDFVWAIHPGQDIQWNDTDRNLLIAKFEKMYELGVRSFAVFFDDISGEGTNPDRQAELLNYLDDHFVKVKKDVTPLIMCPTEYNKSWSNPAKGYLTTLGQKLNKSVQIMWTGDRVVSDISSEGIAWINERIQRPAYIWWNFPVSDYVRDHLLMGAVYGNDTQIANQMSGFVSNPMEHPEASKIAIFGVADYAWNPLKYNPQEAWERAIRTLLPQDAAALQTFANHNSDLGNNGHRYRREESVQLQPLADRFLTHYTQGTYHTAEADSLQKEFERIVESADLLLVNKENEPLIQEMTPWLQQFKLMGQMGQEVLTLAAAYQNNDQTTFTNKYKHIKALQQLSFGIDQTYNQNPYQPGVKVGTKVLQPLIDKTFSMATERYNEKYGTQLNATTSYSPHKLVTNIEQLKYQPLQIKTNRIMISPLLETVKWPASGTLTIELERPYTGKNIEMDLGVKEVATWGSLEVSPDGVNWTLAKLKQENNKVTVDLQNSPIKAVRFTNTSNREQEVYLRRFVITADK